MNEFQGQFNIRLTDDSAERVLISRQGLNKSAILRLLEGSPIIQMDDSVNGAYMSLQ